MSNTTANPYGISLTEMLKQEGRTFEAMAEEVMFGDANALALCTEHCEVEPDGTPEDNKLRLYSTTRLDSETYDRVKADGFIWAPKQDLQAFAQSSSCWTHNQLPPVSG